MAEPETVIGCDVPGHPNNYVHQHGPIVRIPLTIEAPLGKTEGLICAVMVADLDALEADNERLRAQLDAAQLRSIEARNPGIDMDEVRRSRAGRNSR